MCLEASSISSFNKNCWSDSSELIFNLPFEDNYFDSIDYSKQVINELIRVTKPLGQILIGDINDFDKKELYLSIRNKENRNTVHKVKSVRLDHQFYKKSLFLEKNLSSPSLVGMITVIFL